MLTWIEIDLKALDFNLKQFRSLIGPEVLLMPVIKSNAYGHGMEAVAKFLDQHSQVDRICVVNLDEADNLRQVGITKPLVILSFFETTDSEKIKRVAETGNIVFPLYTVEQAKALNGVGESIGQPIIVHLKIDTGTTRVGLQPADALSFLKKISKFTHLKLEGLWSHFAQSEEDPKFTKEQAECLQDLAHHLGEHGFKFPLTHIACTASTILYPFAHLDAVRVGLGIYGLHPSPKTLPKLDLTPCLSMYTKVIQVKEVAEGTKIGYGGTFITTEKSHIATLPIGYYDGFDRGFSNNGQVVIKGKLCPVRGRICMNLTMVDVTEVPEVREGDEVMLLGHEEGVSITADDWAKGLGTISYEVVTRLNQQIPRIYKK